MTTAAPPNAFRKVAAPFPVSASSFHHGGVNTLMGDGSVRFVGDGIASWPIEDLAGDQAGASRATPGGWNHVPTRRVWQGLATIRGGEPIASPWDESSPKL